MGAVKGKKTGGRKKGTPNKTTKALKDSIMEAFAAVGGAEYLQTVAKDDPKAFMSLLGRVVPTEIKGEISIPTVKRNFMGRDES